MLVEVSMTTSPYLGKDVNYDYNILMSDSGYIFNSRFSSVDASKLNDSKPVKQEVNGTVIPYSIP